MRELTKQQKIKVIDFMILKVDKDRGLCEIYIEAMGALNYKSHGSDDWTPRFQELSNKIRSEIIRTGGCAFINYGKINNCGFDDKKWRSGRLELLKDLGKELLK